MSEKSEFKNAIWIFGDQHPQHALSCNGNPDVNTPHLDRMAYNGQNYSRAVAGFPLCCPFRGSLLASKYPHECVPGHEYPMVTDQQTVAHAFKAHGFDTAWFGKWHVDGWHERDGRGGLHIVPPERRGGFDTWVGYENNNSQWDCWVHGGEGDGAFQYKLDGYETDKLTDLLIDHIKNHKTGQPFFAALSVQPPHNPYLAPAEYMARHNPASTSLRPNVPPIARIREQAQRDLAGAYAMIENLDWNVGRVTRALDEAGLSDDTNIVFFSDHGDMHGSHGQFKKTSPWEESIRIPFIISGLQDRYGSNSNNQPVLMNHVDIAPTTLGLCGIDPPDWMDGTDYSGLRLPGRPKGDYPDSAYLQNVIPTMHGDSIDRPYRGVITDDNWKYVALEGQPWLLFDLNEDPYELVNLAHNTRHKAQRQKLNERTAQWIADTRDEFQLPVF